MEEAIHAAISFPHAEAPDEDPERHRQVGQHHPHEPAHPGRTWFQVSLLVRRSPSQEAYSAAKVRRGLGRPRSIREATASDHRIIQGVERVVMAETVTATGYRNSRVAPEARPTPAMMKENSPIWERVIPALTEVRTPYPARKPPSVTPTILPATTRSVNRTTAIQWRATRSGSISIPTETKNIAANTSRSGSTSRSTSSPRSRFRDQRAADEGTQRDGIPEAVGQQRGGEADPDAGHERRLRAVQPDDGAYQAGNDQHPEDQETGEKREEAPARPRKFPRRDGAAGGNGRKDRQQEDGDQVLDDQDAEDGLGELPLDALLRERLDDDRRAGDGEDRAAVETLQRSPAEHPARHVPQPDHEAGLHQGGHARGRHHVEKPSEVEFEPQGEHEENDAEFRQRVDRGKIGDQGDGDVGPDDHAGDEVSEDHRLAEPLEDHRGDPGDAENRRQVLEKFGSAVHGSTSPRRTSAIRISYRVPGILRGRTAFLCHPGWLPAHHDGDVADFEGPLGPECDLDCLFSIVRHRTTVVALLGRCG